MIVDTTHLERACEGVDACVFTGVFGAEHQAMLKEYIARWTRAIEAHEAETAVKQLNEGE